ncbi:hypothetical protein [Agromyces sp. SYSU T00194]|uniref:hypothetical protein n=1 Tax=Agromyces chitinivorans TaxID=3158560 RepID=UPI0033998B01
MAGNYPDAPAARMAYDQDGSIAVHTSAAGVLTELTELQRESLNDESSGYFDLGSNVTSSVTAMSIIFPDARDITSIFVQDLVTFSGAERAVEVSDDTTNGQDGTWTQVGTWVEIPDSTEVPAIAPAYRTTFITISELAVRGIRVRYRLLGSNGFYARLRVFHVYGDASPGASTHRLEFWHPTNDERLPAAWLDWGDTPRSSSQDRDFRIKNSSPSLTANDVQVAMNALTDATPSTPGQHTMSIGGGAFSSIVTVGDLAPGAISGVVTLRRITPSNAQLGVWAMRLFAESDDWS